MTDFIRKLLKQQHVTRDYFLAIYATPRMTHDEIVKCQDCIRAQQRGQRSCARHQQQEAHRQVKLRSRRKAEGRCRCGNELPEFKLISGKLLAKECLVCFWKRERTRMHSVMLTTALNSTTGEYELIARRGRLMPEKLTASAQNAQNVLRAVLSSETCSDGESES